MVQSQGLIMGPYPYLESSMAIYQPPTQSDNGGGFKGVNVGADMRGIG